MFDIGWTELLVIGVVALIVVGPKDLPGMFRTLGRFTGKMRKMAREFQRAMEQAADESGLKEVTKEFKDVSSIRGKGLDAFRNAASDFSSSWTGAGKDSKANTAKSKDAAASAPDSSSRSDGEDVPKGQGSSEAEGAGTAAASNGSGATADSGAARNPDTASARDSGGGVRTSPEFSPPHESQKGHAGQKASA